MIKVLFVCLGNICRSPMAEGLFINHLNDAGLSAKIGVDSCGTGAWHVGERPDSRMQATADAYGVHLPSISRQLNEEDFEEFDYIIPMDRKNLRNIKAIQPRGSKAEIYLIRDFDDQGKGEDVPDPYYLEGQGFEQAYQMLLRSTKHLLEHIIVKHAL